MRGVRSGGGKEWIGTETGQRQVTVDLGHSEFILLF